MSRSREVDAYIAALPSPARERVAELRATVHAAAPGAEEVIRRGLPAFRHRERPLVGIGAAQRHAALYIMYGAVLTTHRAEIHGHDHSNTVVRFPLDAAIPTRLVATLVRARVAEIERG